MHSSITIMYIELICRRFHPSYWIYAKSNNPITGHDFLIVKLSIFVRSNFAFPRVPFGKFLKFFIRNRNITSPRNISLAFPHMSGLFFRVDDQLFRFRTNLIPNGLIILSLPFLLCIISPFKSLVKVFL